MVNPINVEAKKREIKPSKHSLRILFNTNAPFCPSGYAQQMYDLLPRIKKAGFEVACIAFYGLEGGIIDWKGIKIYPRMGDMWGGDAMLAHGKKFEADVTMTLQDIWTLDPNILRQTKNWVPYVPIDHDPCPPSVFERLKMAYRIVTMSKFGYEDLKSKGVNSTCITHSIDTSIMKIIDKAEAKTKLGIPADKFMFGMIAANKDNPPRKAFQESMDAFKMFHDKHPKSGLYIHTILQQQGGFPIQDYANYLGITDSLYYIDPYDYMYSVAREDIYKIFNAFDVYLAPSTSEGFGIPVIEAQACGVPVIIQPFTAPKDLIIPGETGWFCKTSTKRFTALLSYIGIPDTQSIYDCMEESFVADREKMGKKAREFIVENFDSEKVFNEKWYPFFCKLEKEIKQVDTKPTQS